MKKVLLIVLVFTLMLAITIPVFADPPEVPDVTEGNSPGKSYGKGNSAAGGHCEKTWNDTPLAGDTGSANDEKQPDSIAPGVDTGVGNCDQWWNWDGGGSNGPADHPQGP